MGERDCINHTGTRAVGQCYMCHKPVCRACMAATPTGVFCSEECYAKYVAYQGRKQPLVKSSRFKSVVVGLFILIVLAAAVIYIGGSLGIPVLKAIRDRAIEAIRGMLP